MLSITVRSCVLLVAPRTQDRRQPILYYRRTADDAAVGHRCVSHNGHRTDTYISHSRLSRRSIISLYVVDRLATVRYWPERISGRYVLQTSSMYFAARCYACAVLAMGLCPCLSVSVTNRCSTETAKRRITQTKPHDRPGL